MLTKGTDGLAVLVVDDASIIRASCERALKRAGYKVQSAESGEAALDIMERNPAKVMLLDIRMPGMSGVEVLRRVKQKWPHTEVVIMTAYADQDIAEESLKLGASEIMIKPFDNIREVTEAVGKAFGRNKIRSSGEEDDDLVCRLLADAGLVSQQQIRNATHVAKDRGIGLKSALLTMGVITQDDIEWAVARYLEIPYVSIQPAIMDKELLMLFPPDLARSFMCLPLWRDQEALHIVMADPFNGKAIAEIEKTTGEKVKPAKGDEREIKRMIAKIYESRIESNTIEELMGMMDEKDIEKKCKIIETIFSKISISSLGQASFRRIQEDMYEFNIEGVARSKGGARG